MTPAHAPIPLSKPLLLCVCVCVCRLFKICTSFILPVRLYDASSIRHSCSSNEIVYVCVVKLIFLHLQTAKASFPLGLQEAPRIFRHSAHEGSKVVSPKHRPPLQPRRHPWYSFLLAAESTHTTVGRIKSATTSGIESAAFRIDDDDYIWVRDLRAPMHLDLGLPDCSAVPQPTAPPRTSHL